MTKLLFSISLIFVLLFESVKLQKKYSLLDRRLGKRRLLALEESMEPELDWVRAFYAVSYTHLFGLYRSEGGLNGYTYDSFSRMTGLTAKNGGLFFIYQPFCLHPDHIEGSHPVQLLLHGGKYITF